VSVLHQIGDLLREALLAVPLWAARVLFLALPVVVLVWVLTLPGAETRPPGRPARASENLKIWAALALVIQIVIYSLL
jgi:hypothetical protein